MVFKYFGPLLAGSPVEALDQLGFGFFAGLVVPGSPVLEFLDLNSFILLFLEVLREGVARTCANGIGDGLVGAFDSGKANLGHPSYFLHNSSIINFIFFIGVPMEY